MASIRCGIVHTMPKLQVHKNAAWRSMQARGLTGGRGRQELEETVASLQCNGQLHALYVRVANVNRRVGAICDVCATAAADPLLFPQEWPAARAPSDVA